MFKSNCQLTIFRRSVLHDGTFSFAEETGISAFFMERLRTLADGSSEDFSEVLLPPEVSPLPGDQLEIKGLRRTQYGTPRPHPNPAYNSTHRTLHRSHSTSRFHIPLSRYHTPRLSK